MTVDAFWDVGCEGGQLLGFDSAVGASIGLVLYCGPATSLWRWSEERDGPVPKRAVFLAAAGLANLCGAF